MSVALHGNLRDFGIAEVFQLIGQQRKTGRLEVSGDDARIFLVFDSGRVVRGGRSSGRATDRNPLGLQLVRAGYLTREQLDNAERESARSARALSDLLLSAGLIEARTLEEVQDLLTRETVFEVMRRKSGDFHFTAESVQHDLPPERLLGAEQILMDGLRMLDEWQTFYEVVPDPEAVFCRAGTLEDFRAMAGGQGEGRLEHATRVFQLVDGRLPVRRIIDLSRIGTFEATRALAELREAGIVDVVDTSTRRSGSETRSRKRFAVLPVLRAALATAVPFVALFGLGLVAADRAERRVSIAGAPLPDPVASRVGARRTLLHLRQLVDDHYLAHGAYPADLTSLTPLLRDSSHSLTAEQLADYYYAVRGQEVVLLAPVAPRVDADADDDGAYEEGTGKGQG